MRQWATASENGSGLQQLYEGRGAVACTNDLEDALVYAPLPSNDVPESSFEMVVFVQTQVFSPQNPEVPRVQWCESAMMDHVSEYQEGHKSKISGYPSSWIHGAPIIGLS